MTETGSFHVAAIRAALFAAGLLMLGLLLGACGSGSAAQKEEEAAPASEEELVTETFAGVLPGSEAFVAVVTSPENNVLAYVCDNERIAEWFLGSVEDGSLDLASNSGARLRAEFTPGEARGTLTLDGEEFPFTAEPVEGESGLYRATKTVDGEEWVGGWILLPNGEERGLAKSRETNQKQVPGTVFEQVAGSTLGEEANHIDGQLVDQLIHISE